jgi:hypothetical protein
MKSRLTFIPPQLAVRNSLLAMGAVAAVVAVGVVMLSVKAATDATAVESESGSRSANATLVTDGSASGSSAVKFSASPAGDANCPAYPAFPDASCTGWQHTGVTLTKVPSQATSGNGWVWDSGGYVRLTATNVTVSGLDIDGSVIGKDGMTIKNSYIRCTGEHSWCLTLGTGSTVVDTEIGGGANGTTWQDAVAVYASGTVTAPDTILRVNIHHTIHGPHIDGNTLMADAYCHDVPMSDPVTKQDGSISTSDHTECIFISTGHNITIRHNTFGINCGNSACLFVQDYDNDAQGVGELHIEYNKFLANSRNGSEPSYGASVENKDIKGNVYVQNNVFSKSPWTVGPMNVPASWSTVNGNTYTDGSSADAAAIFGPKIY